MGVVKGAIIAMLITIVLYLVPYLNVIAAFIGGFAGAYVETKTAVDGLKVGLLMTVLSAIPFVALLAFLGPSFASEWMPGIVAFVGVTFVLLGMVFIGFLGILGATLGGYVSKD